MTRYLTGFRERFVPGSNNGLSNEDFGGANTISKLPFPCLRFNPETLFVFSMFATISIVGSIIGQVFICFALAVVGGLRGFDALRGIQVSVAVLRLLLLFFDFCLVELARSHSNA